MAAVWQANQIKGGGNDGGAGRNGGATEDDLGRTPVPETASSSSHTHVGGESSKTAAVLVGTQLGERKEQFHRVEVQGPCYGDLKVLTNATLHAPIHRQRVSWTRCRPPPKSDPTGINGIRPSGVGGGVTVSTGSFTSSFHSRGQSQGTSPPFPSYRVRSWFDLLQLPEGMRA